MKFLIEIDSTSSASEAVSNGELPVLGAYATTAHRVRVNGLDVGKVVEFPGRSVHARCQIRSLVSNAILPLTGGPISA